MGASGQSVQDPHHERSPRLYVKMRRSLAVRMRRRVVGGMVMHMDVRVAMSVVLVLMHVHALPRGLPNAPRADRDQHQPHEPFAPAGQALDREHLPQEECRQPDDHHAAGVAEAPEEARGPGTLFPVGREWRDGRQVVRPGEDVDRARRKPGDDGSDHGVPVLSAEGGGP